MKFILPSLPYEYGALEPYIDAQTMEIHHSKHHQKYVDELNNALEKHPEIKVDSVGSLLVDLAALPADIRTEVRNNGGGHFNHSLFWQIMKKNAGGEPNGLLAEEIKNSFGTFAAFQDIFNTHAKKVFGSGWAWLSVDKAGKLIVTSLANQDSPLSHDAVPIMGLDVWEHAYYLKYHNKRPDYIAAWWHVINWDMIEENYRAIVNK
jgi:superoxide dismutase, Fe-Mn family